MMNAFSLFLILFILLAGGMVLRYFAADVAGGISTMRILRKAFLPGLERRTERTLPGLSHCQSCRPGSVGVLRLMGSSSSLSCF